MNHLPIASILLAAFGGFLLTIFGGAGIAWQRRVSVALIAGQLALAVAALAASLDGPTVYALGDWPAPFGIVLVLDRLSALMVLLTTLVATGSLLAAIQGWDARGRLFHALFHFQLMGLYGAFLTGDLFNLFVFFEVLLIASYGLLLHGQGPRRARAGVKYVVVNLTGSALFLVAVGTLYGITGTLNMADMNVALGEVSPADAPWLRASLFLFLVVFGTKAALLPLFFWLPDAYSSASPPVAALFAIMTKVGLYAILRVYTLALGADGAVAAGVADWLLAVALATLVAGMAGAVQAASLGRLAAYLGVASVGTTMTAIATFSPAAIAGGLYYLAHSTLALAMLFLLTGQVARLRGPDSADRLAGGQAVPTLATTGLAFMLVAVAMAGVPPLSGFLGKVLILEGVTGHGAVAVIWSVILATSLMAVIALSRAASRIFWKSGKAGPIDTATPATGGAGLVTFGALIVVMTVFAGPIEGFTRDTAVDLLEPSGYVDAVLSNRNVVTVEGSPDG